MLKLPVFRRMLHREIPWVPDVFRKVGEQLHAARIAVFLRRNMRSDDLPVNSRSKSGSVDLRLLCWSNDICAMIRTGVVVPRFLRDGKEYEGKPLSDPDVFADAGTALGEELIRKAKDTLKDRRVLEGKKGEYHKYMNKVKKHEKAMQAAGVFSGPDADDVLIDLWKFALELSEREYARLGDDYQKMRQGRRRVPISAFHELEKLRKKAAQVADTWKKHYIDLMKYGFYYSESLELEEFE